MAIFLLSVFDFWGVSPIKTGDFPASHLGFQEGSLRNTQENKQKSKHKHTEKQNTLRCFLAPKTLPIKRPTTGRRPAENTQLELMEPVATLPQSQHSHCSPPGTPPIFLATRRGAQF